MIADWYTLTNITADIFIKAMLGLGTPIDLSLVGVFNDSARGSRRDIDLPLHKDGIYSEALAEIQAGYFVENPDIDIVGLYCIKDGSTPCYTIINDGKTTRKINLSKGEALIFDNRKVEHGREGPVSDRLLLRMWIKKNEM